MQAAYKANDPASSTPAADERGVVAFFPDPEFGLVFPSAIMLVRYTQTAICLTASTIVILFLLIAQAGI